jgi:hypothetical protein
MIESPKPIDKEVGCGKSFLIGVAIFIAILFFAKLTSTQNQSNTNSQPLPTSTLTELEKCREDLESGVPYDYSSCNPVDQLAIDEAMLEFDSLPNPLVNDDSSNSSSVSNSCPIGCTTQVTGCNIKGNVKYENGEKIYHLPGMDYYDETKINIEYGERWFCTEAEAINNGFRKANDY